MVFSEDEKDLLSRIDERLKGVEKSLKELEQKTLGDGNTGLLGRTLLNTAAIEAIQKSTIRRDEFWQRISIIVVGTIITNVGVIVVAAILIALNLK